MINQSLDRRRDETRLRLTFSTAACGEALATCG